HQELSAQQVSTYLLALEDHYTSHTYANLYWTSFERTVDSFVALSGNAGDETRNRPANETDQDAETTDAYGNVFQDLEDSEDENPEEEVDIEIDPWGNIMAGPTKTDDYIFRGDELQDVCLWDFVGRVEKVSKKNDQRK